MRVVHQLRSQTPGESAFETVRADLAQKGVVDRLVRIRWIPFSEKAEQRPTLALERRRVRRHHHAIRQRRGAGRYRPRRSLHLDEAQAAGADGIESIVVAEVRDVGARASQPIEDGRPLPELSRLAVQNYAKHVASSSR